VTCLWRDTASKQLKFIAKIPKAPLIEEILA